MADSGSGDKGKTIKIVIIVVLFAATGYFVWANYGGGGKKQPVSAADRASDELKQQNEEYQKKMDAMPDEVIGGS